MDWWRGYTEWPPRSPDLIHLGFLFMEALKPDVFKTQPDSLEEFQLRNVKLCHYKHLFEILQWISFAKNIILEFKTIVTVVTVQKANSSSH